MANWSRRLPAAGCGLLLFASLLGCQQVSETQLLGLWTAETVVQEQDTVDLDLEFVRLYFGHDTFVYTYTMRDTLRGNYKVDQPLLVLYVDSPHRDTLRLEIARYQSSDLLLKMHHEGKERLVTFRR